MYKPTRHSRHFMRTLISDGSKNGEKRKISKDAQAVLCFVFGMETQACARTGRSMAEFHSVREQPTNSCCPGLDKYHDRFVSRDYVQEVKRLR